MGKKVFLIIFLSIVLFPVLGTNIMIPSLEITTKIYNTGSELVMQSNAFLEMIIEGGYKFGGKVVFGFDGFLAYPDSLQFIPQLAFKSASLTVRDIFETPLDFSYFIGESDYICYGDDFVRLYGTVYLHSNYLAFYETIIYQTPLITFLERYKGLHRINGNGIKLEYYKADEPFGFAWYLYQDLNFSYHQLTSPAVNLSIFYFDTGYYSTDLRCFLNFEGFKFEGYVGGTIDSADASLGMRFGSLFYFGVDEVNFLLVAGVPLLDSTTLFDLNLFFILFESRISLGPVTIIPTVFFRPSHYLQKDNTDLNFVTRSEANRIDFNLNLGIFNPRKDIISFGFEGNLQTQNLLVQDPYQLDLFVSPYLTFATPGVYWQIKVSFPFMLNNSFLDLEHIFTSAIGVINIQAEF